MYWVASNPWRCWERTTLAGVLNGPDDLLVRVALLNTRTRTYQSEFRWPALVRLGPNDYRGRYSQITLRFGEVRWSLETAGDEARTYILVRCLDPEKAGDIQIQLETLFLLPGGQIVAREEEVIARRQPSAWRVSAVTPAAKRMGATITAPLERPFMAMIEPTAEPGRRLEARHEGPRVAGDRTTPLTDAERAVAATVAEARREYLGQFSYVPPEMWWLYAAIPYGIGWNMIWAADRREPVQVCSRDWCVHGTYGEWVLFNWDTFLLAPAAAEYDVELAHQIVRPQLAVQTPEGLIPGVASPLGASADRGMPPDASLGLYQAYLASGDRSFVEPYYERLMRYHNWWRRNRDGNGDGLLEWGSNPTEAAHPQWQSHSFWASRYETGMDNHPMWDDVRFKPDTNTQEQNCVGLSALHAVDALCLARMAEVLERGEDRERLETRARRVGELIEQRLWNDEVGLWLSRGWNQEWNQRASPICFYPFFLATSEKPHVRRAIEEHLRNPRRFGGQYVMPVSPRDDPAYPEQYYVRGRIWPAQMLLVHWGLREQGEEEAAAELARGAIETMKREWLEEGHLHENYHAETADGDDTWESDPLYSFGVMLPMIAWNHVRGHRLDGQRVEADPAVLGEHLDHDGSLRRQVDPFESLPPLA